MSKYEEKLEQLNKEKKIIYYDTASFLNYNLSLIKEEKDLELKKDNVLYTSMFLDNLPDYKIFGTKIKDLIKFSFSNGNCHFCAFILSLCFEDFEIETANLKNYAKHHNSISDLIDYWDDFTHSFLRIKYSDVLYVIDTTFGFIIKYDDYKELFDLDNEHIYSSELVKSTMVYRFFNHNKLSDEKITKFRLYEYLAFCQKEKCNDKSFQYFMNVYMTFPLYCRDFTKWDERVNMVEEVVANSSFDDLQKSDVFGLIRKV